VPWLQLRFTVPRELAEPLGEALEAFGAQAVTMQGASSDSLFDQIDETPTLWLSTNLTALFDADDDIDAVIDGVTKMIAPSSLPPHEVSVLADQDWNRAWMDRFRPMRFGRRLWVVPSWHRPPEPDAVNLILDPGMAFGTGTHPTTSLCLEWLDAADLRGRRVLDYGCGSGILAIAAIRLGAPEATAVDIDPQCLEVTRENSERNATLGQMRIGLASVSLSGPFDVLVANILAGPLHQLAERFAELVRPGGDIVLSGLLAPQAEECRRIYEADFVMQAPRLSGDWAMLHGTRRITAPDTSSTAG
jgi:ribosomal protein L11 methyltransferase